MFFKKLSFQLSNNLNFQWEGCTYDLKASDFKQSFFKFFLSSQCTPNTYISIYQESCSQVSLIFKVQNSKFKVQSSSQIVKMSLPLSLVTVQCPFTIDMIVRKNKVGWWEKRVDAQWVSKTREIL